MLLYQINVINNNNNINDDMSKNTVENYKNNIEEDY